MEYKTAGSETNIPPYSLGVISTSRRRELLVAVEENKVISVWNLVSDTQIAELPERYKGVTRLAFSPDSELLESGSYDGTILLWDMKPFI